MTETQQRWQVAVDHPAFAGHFPGRPIVPGVLLLDRALALAAAATGTSENGWQVGNAKFLSPVGPGEWLTLTLKPGAGSSIAFTIHADTRLVASGSLTPPRQ